MLTHVGFRAHVKIASRISYIVVLDCTSTETLWNRKASSLSSPEDEEIIIIIIIIIMLDIQNYGCNCNLLCYHGVVERNRSSSLQSHGKALEKEC